MDVASENPMYGYFSEENSIKIKNVLIGKRKRGKYLAIFVAFGYKKSPSDHNCIVIDEEACESTHEPIISKELFESVNSMDV